MGIDFGGMIRRSFEIAWRYKSLWVFGLFAGAGGNNFNFDWPTGRGFGGNDWRGFERSGDLDWLQGLPDEMLAGMAVGAIFTIALLLLLFFICYNLAMPAMVDAVNKITRGGSYSFSSSFSRGVDFFWQFVALSILSAVCGITTVGVVVILAIVLTPLSLLLTIPAAIVVGFTLFHTFSLAEVALVARNSTVGDALAEGFGLLKRNVGNCIMMSLILIGLVIAFVIVVSIVALMAFLPINLIVGAVADSWLPVLILGLVIGLPVSIVLGGYTGTFFNSVYVQFYFQLVEPSPIPSTGRGHGYYPGPDSAPQGHIPPEGPAPQGPPPSSPPPSSLPPADPPSSQPQRPDPGPDNDKPDNDYNI